MFLMDGIDVSAGPEIRQKRKDAINTMHKHLASIDTVHKPEEAEPLVEADAAAGAEEESEPAAAADAKDEFLPVDEEKKQV
ncbi:hypothetical protein D0Z00_003839 [Geotrichum galactomycetum]|uniref:Uncharacterized protein n=1 Tax=Geotrichum galactomycetum TaxID=27317 RepID=A0ACB6V026_9ASCO|nr:hypothetical protein D0Z00_003839 [Geotrichum candidum]